MPDFTPIQTKMMNILQDGKEHHKEELFACLNDTLSPVTNIKYHLSKLRDKLLPVGHDIVCVGFMKRKYRLVRLLAEKYDE